MTPCLISNINFNSNCVLPYAMGSSFFLSTCKTNFQSFFSTLTNKVWSTFFEIFAVFLRRSSQVIVFSITRKVVKFLVLLLPFFYELCFWIYQHQMRWSVWKVKRLFSWEVVPGAHVVWPTYKSICRGIADPSVAISWLFTRGSWCVKVK